MSKGIRAAKPGEFSQRAVLNGKMSLVEAEMINHLIKEESPYIFNSIKRSLNGNLNAEMEKLVELFINFKTFIEANISFDDHEDIEISSHDKIFSIVSLKDKITNFLNNYKLQRQISSGLKIAIIGKANSGKSTLFNKLINDERAIVDDFEGTTRDYIEGRVIIKNLPVLFIDTAGFKNELQSVDKISIEKTFAIIEKADLLLYLISCENNDISEDLKILSKIDKPKIILFSKSDIISETGIAYKQLAGETTLKISIKSGSGIDELVEKLQTKIIEIFECSEEQLFIPERHYLHLLSILKYVSEIEKLLLKGSTDDIIGFITDKIIYELQLITGQKYEEQIIDSIFQNFCIGK